MTQDEANKEALSMAYAMFQSSDMHRIFPQFDECNVDCDIFYNAKEYALKKLKKLLPPNVELRGCALLRSPSRTQS
jgi:hypothetical protein